MCWQGLNQSWRPIFPPHFSCYFYPTGRQSKHTFSSLYVIGSPPPFRVNYIECLLSVWMTKLHYFITLWSPLSSYLYLSQEPSQFSMTKWLYHLFNVRPFTTVTIASNVCQSRSKILPKSKWTFKKPQGLKISPKWQKFGHIRSHCPSCTLFTRNR